MKGHILKSYRVTQDLFSSLLASSRLFRRKSGAGGVIVAPIAWLPVLKYK